MTGRAAHRVAAVVAGALLVPALVVAAAAATKTFTGSLDAAGTSWRAHTFQVTATGTIDATLSWDDAAANLNMFLYDPSGTIVAQATSTTAMPETITYDASVTGTWKIGIKAKTGAATYTLTVTFPTTGGTEPAYVATIGGGTAGHAEMYPSGVDVDANGNVYVADTGDDQVQKYDGAGNPVWTIGSHGPKAPGRFENPRDVAYAGGKVYVADTGYNRVQVLNASDGSLLSVWSYRFGTIMGISAGVDANGATVILAAESSANTIRVFTTGGSLIRSVGSGPGSGHGQLNGARDAATDAAGTIYVADFANSRVAVFSPTGTPIVEWGVNGTGPSQLKRPYGIDLDAAGNVYVADSNNYIHEFTPSGTFIRAYGSPGSGAGTFQMLRRVAVGSGSSPRVYGADLWTYKIEVFAADGTNLPGALLGGVPPQDGYFNEPYGFAVDADHVFVVDMVNQRVQRFATGTRAFQLTWGERGWGEGNPGFNWARDATLGTNGGSQTVWVADTKNNRLTEFWPDGTPTGRKFGKAGSAIGQLNWPFAVDSYGTDLILANTRDNRIERWNPGGPSVVWSTSSAGGIALNAPKDLYVAGDRVYVVDTLNRRVVVLSATNGSVIDTFGSGLHLAEGIAVDPAGDVWVSDTSWNRLVELSPSGAVLQTFGSLGGNNSQFNKPAHLEVLVAGGATYLYVVDSWNDRVQIFLIG